MVETQESGDRLQETLGLSEREMIDNPYGKCRLNREVGVDPLTTGPRPRRGLPSLDGALGEPERELTALP